MAAQAAAEVVSAEQRAALDATIRALCERGAIDDAAGTLLRGYGPELCAFVAGQLRDETLAADAFAIASEDLWRGLGSFRFEASVRSWAYRVVRHACARVARDLRRRQDRNIPLSQAPLVEELVHELREATARWKKTAERDRLRALRESLTADDQALLTLRIDRGLSWLEIADALTDDASMLDEAQRKKAAAALRKRYERLRDRLRDAAIAAGLVPEPS